MTDLSEIERGWVDRGELHAAGGGDVESGGPGIRGIVSRKWLALLLSGLLGLAGGGVYRFVALDEYTATAYNLVIPEDGTRTADAVAFAQALGRVTDSPVIIAEPLRAAGLTQSIDEVRQRVRVSVSPDAPLIEISATSEQPGEAGLLANTVSRALAAYAEDRREQTGVRAEQFAPATPPQAPSGPGFFLILAIGLVLGLLLGAVVTLVPLVGQSQP